MMILNVLHCSGCGYLLVHQRIASPPKQSCAKGVQQVTAHYVTRRCDVTEWNAAVRTAHLEILGDAFDGVEICFGFGGDSGAEFQELCEIQRVDQ